MEDQGYQVMENIVLPKQQEREYPGEEWEVINWKAYQANEHSFIFYT